MLCDKAANWTTPTQDTSQGFMTGFTQYTHIFDLNATALAMPT
jgi:hypothetical protein